MKRRKVFLAVAAVTVSALAAPSPAGAAMRQALPAPALVADPAAANRDFVRWLSVHDPRAGVRSAAQATLAGGAGAITAFLGSGYTAAAGEAARVRAGQLDFATRMATAHPAPTYPWVNAAARRAANGTDAELAEFSSTGYAAALAKDNARIPYDDGAAQVTEADHDFVRALARIDASNAVRERAADVETDADVAEFLRHGWLSAGGIDRDAFRAQYVADEWSRWSEARYVTSVAVAVDQAAREGTASPVAAIQAWEDVRTRFVRQPTRWTERQRFAHGRFDAWTQNSLRAGDAESPLWAALVTEGSAMRSEWIAELNGAGEQSAWWSHLLQHAEAAAARWFDYTA